jgi:hypothetical protein
MTGQDQRGGWQQEDIMMETDIIRLNIERFQRMLETEFNESTRRTIESMIREFEGMLSSSGLGKRPGTGEQ